jgi:hypothetical protein
MTKKLEDLLNISSAKEILDEERSKSDSKAIQQTETEEVFDRLAEFDKINAALPSVKGLGDKADGELDDIASRALNSYEDLMNLGMNVESRYSGRIFETAGNMLKTSLEAKAAKLDKKLKMIDLQLKKQKIDQDNNLDEGETIHGEGTIVTDRNSLLEKLKNMDK